jgi:hypothetical protein
MAFGRKAIQNNVIALFTLQHSGPVAIVVPSVIIKTVIAKSLFIDPPRDPGSLPLRRSDAKETVKPCRSRLSRGGMYCSEQREASICATIALMYFGKARP